MSSQTLDLDITKDSRIRTNVWLLLTIIGGVLATYALWRDTSENNRERIREHEQQERHFQSTDARVVSAEQRLALLERSLDKMVGNIEYLREAQEREERRRTYQSK